MDVAFGVAGLVGLTLQLIEVVGFLKSANHFTASASELWAELNAFQAVLKEADEALKDKEQTIFGLQGLPALNQAKITCEARLRMTLDRLETVVSLTKG